MKLNPRGKKRHSRIQKQFYFNCILIKKNHTFNFPRITFVQTRQSVPQSRGSLSINKYTQKGSAPRGTLTPLWGIHSIHVAQDTWYIPGVKQLCIEHKALCGGCLLQGSLYAGKFHACWNQVKRNFHTFPRSVSFRLTLLSI